MENKNNLIVVVSFVAGLIIGGGASYMYVNNSYKGNTYADGFGFAQKRLLETNPMFKMLENQEVKTVAGTVEKVSGNSLTIKINPLEPLADVSLDTREVTVDSNTKIVVATMKNTEDFQKEISNYQKQIQKIAKEGKGDMPKVPEQFIKLEGKISDITKSSSVTISTSKDMKKSKTFTAVEITVQKN